MSETYPGGSIEYRPTPTEDGSDAVTLPRGSMAVATRGRPTSRAVLTATQRRVLVWMAEGKSREEIGVLLGGRSTHTVRNHIRNIFDAVGAMCREDVYAAVGWLTIKEWR